MAQNVPLTRKMVPFDDWPELDQAQWGSGLRPAGWLDPPKFAAKLRPASLRSAERAWGRLLGFLYHSARLIEDKRPGDRVTGEVLDEYVEHLRSTGNTNNTIKTRLMALRTALRILEPNEDFGWITRPCGISLHNLFPVALKRQQPPSSDELYAWGQTLMKEALLSPEKATSPVQFRDGLLIALFAARAPRVSSMATLRAKKDVTLVCGHYRIAFPGTAMKNGRPLEYDVPDSIASLFRHYLEVVRPALLGTRINEMLWIGKHGRGITLNGIATMFRRRFYRRFANGKGPHVCRHALATSAAERDPSNPGLSSCILNTQDAVVRKHYQHVRAIHAGRQFHAFLAKDRTRLKPLADQ